METAMQDENLTKEDLIRMRKQMEEDLRISKENLKKRIEADVKASKAYFAKEAMKRSKRRKKANTVPTKGAFGGKRK